MKHHNMYCYTPSFFLLYKSNTINTKHFGCLQQNPYSLQNCSIDQSTVHRSIARYQTVDRWPYIFIGSISHVILIDITVQRRRPDSRT